MRALRLVPLILILGLAMLRFAFQTPGGDSTPRVSRTYAPPKPQMYTPPPPHPVYRRPGDPLPPPPPDPATTQAYVPPMTNFQGTPAALSAPDLQRQIEKRYEDMDYAFLTRKAAAMGAFYDDKVREGNDVITRAEEQKMWQEHFDEINALEQKYEVSVRLGSSNKVVKCTPKGADKVAVQFELTERLMANVGGSSYQTVWTRKGRDLWVHKGDTWLISESSSSEPEEHSYVDGQEIED